MKNYSQKSEPWGSREIVKGVPMSKYGCVVTSIACLIERDPGEILSILQSAQAFTVDGKLIWDKAAKAIGGLAFDGYTDKPNFPCIGITDHFMKDYGVQHFFVWMNEGGMIIDPLDGLTKVNPYHIERYVQLYSIDVKKNRT